MILARRIRMSGLALVLAAGRAWGATPPDTEPRVTSIFPLSVVAGKPTEVSIRGRNLKEARGVWFPGGGIRSRILRVETDESGDNLCAELTLDGKAPGGTRQFRVVTAAGVSNAIELRDADAPAITDASAGEPLSRFPLILDGRIAKRGDVNTHPIAVQAGQVLTFEVRSGFQAFDPSITLAERSGSWFDPDRVNPIASNDEPLYFPGLSTDARLVHRFERAGNYLVRIASFSGMGGPDYGYELKITPGETPPPDLHPHLAGAWDERQFTRRIGPDWMTRIAGRGDSGGAPKTVESFRAVTEGTAEVPVFSPPGLVDGRIAHAGEAHVIRMNLEQAQNLAIEIETPEATLPRFNPVVRLMESGGQEVVTNVYTKLNNNGLYMMKMIQAKTAFPLAAPGAYTLQIRDITTDHAGPEFHYRVLVRPQIPHVGKLICSADHLNLSAGETRTLTVTVDREEEFAGVVALAVENLPPGVTAAPAMEQPVERPPLPNGGKLERYVSKPQTASVLLVAAPGAPLSEEPVTLRVVARPVVKGQLKEPLPVGEIPMMVVARRPS
jgi:hypothetical protein